MGAAFAPKGKLKYKAIEYDEKEQERRKKEEAKADLKKEGPRGKRIKYKGTKLENEVGHGAMLEDKTSTFVKKGKRASVAKAKAKKKSSKKKMKKKKVSTKSTGSASASSSSGSE